MNIVRLIVVGALLFVLANSAQASQLQNCDFAGTLARKITEQRDAGTTADTMRRVLETPTTDAESRAYADLLITDIYSSDSRGLSPDDVAAKVMEGCLGSGHRN